MRKTLLLLLLVCASSAGYNQPKAYIVLNAWENELTKYNPTTYLNQLFTLLQNKLAVKELVHDAASLTDTSNKEQLDSWVEERIAKREAVGKNDYFIAVGSQLKLPLINISRILFKSSVQTSKLTLYLHIYNSSGTKVVSDTMISRGCIQNKTSDKKGSKEFYDSYPIFQQDMQCHLEFIKERLKEIQVKK